MVTSTVDEVDVKEEAVILFKKPFTWPGLFKLSLKIEQIDRVNLGDFF